MSRIILIQDDDYERQYLESKNYLHSKFHVHPTRLRNISSADLGDGYNPADKATKVHYKVTPNGKLVI